MYFLCFSPPIVWGLSFLFGVAAVLSMGSCGGVCVSVCPCVRCPSPIVDRRLMRARFLAEAILTGMEIWSSWLRQFLQVWKFEALGVRLLAEAILTGMGILKLLMRGHITIHDERGCWLRLFFQVWKSWGSWLRWFLQVWKLWCDCVQMCKVFVMWCVQMY